MAEGGFTAIPRIRIPDPVNRLPNVTAFPGETASRAKVLERVLSIKQSMSLSKKLFKTAEPAVASPTPNITHKVNPASGRPLLPMQRPVRVDIRTRDTIPGLARKRESP